MGQNEKYKSRIQHNDIMFSAEGIIYIWSFLFLLFAKLFVTICTLYSADESSPARSRYDLRSQTGGRSTLTWCTYPARYKFEAASVYNAYSSKYVSL